MVWVDGVVLKKNCKVIYPPGTWGPSCLNSISDSPASAPSKVLSGPQPACVCCGVVEVPVYVEER